jgi:hypothetical protein
MGDGPANLKLPTEWVEPVTFRLAGGISDLQYPDEEIGAEWR